ncbi:MAG: Ppx/GppA phosphatase family protein [Campylobacter sp.]
MAKRTAVIDLGSNSARMAIFEKTSHYAFHTIGEFKMKLRIGEGAYESGGMISKDAMQKALEVFLEFKNIAKSYKCNKIFAAGTSALRDAPNANELISLIRREVKLSLKIVKGEDEATYGGIAALNLLQPLSEFITIDIGGGSTEMAFVKDGKISQSISLDIGTVRLKELFFDKKDLSGLDEFMKKVIKKLPENFVCKNIVAIGGSLRAISSAIMQNINYPLKTVHNFAYKLANEKEFINKIIDCPMPQLEKFGIKKDRFDTIREGAFIFLNIAKVLGAQSVYTSGIGFREGVYLSDLLRPVKKFPPNFNVSVRSLQDRFVIGDNRAVVRYAEQIFKALSPMHSIDDKFLFELKVGAKLYSIGQSLGFYGEHLSSSYFVLNALNYGFSHRQKVLIATIIGINGKKTLGEFDKFRSLLPDENIVKWLSFILLFAKNLDINCTSNKLEFQFLNHTLQVIGAKKSYMAKENIKKMTKPETFAICFV